ncbi:MAG: trigger factor [Candidatus Eremiobacteraeota bacterium]|nr:trigger factor [Candidatus Eremiobacteraeota bacterium]MCW5868934.1 trigger factor [Candidatus Eremiobacteraeota bacterium]
MQVKVSESSPFERTLEVTVTVDQVEGAYQKAFGRAAKRLRLPGFRPGKVPIPMAKKYISDEGLSSDVVDEVVPKAYVEALRQENLEPISQPKWELVQRERGKDLIFKVSFEVKPVVEIEGYKGVKLKNEKEEIGDDTVNQALDELRGNQSRIVDVEEDRALQEGDLALVDYRSTLDGETVDGGAASNYLMEVQREHFIPGFVDNLVGCKKGEEKEFDITFPEDYPNQTLAGKLVHFHFNLHQIKTRELPEANDDFAKSVSPHATIDELRKDIRERLEANAERKVREQVAIKIIDKLLTQVSNDMVPKSLHQYRTQVELRRRIQQIEQAGLTMERYLADRNVSQNRWVQELSVMGMLESRVEILLNSLASKEDLQPTDAEIEELLGVEAQNRGVSLNQLKAGIDKEGSEPLIRYALLRAKVMDYLFDNAEVEFVPVGTVIEDEPAADEEKKPKAKAKAKKAEEEKAGEEGEAAAKPAKKAREPKEAEEGEAEAKPAKKAKEPKAKAEAEAAEGEEKPKPKRAPKKKTEE